MTDEQIRTEDRVRYTITEDGIADVRLVRADKMNALDDAMFQALITVGQELATNNAVRVVVISGEGRAFCAGLDMGRMAAMKDRDTSVVQEREPIGPAKAMGQQAPYVWTHLQVPVIAAVHGFALGGGFQLALAADIRYVHPETKMSVMELKWGLIPDMTGTQLLAGIVRRDVAKELTYTAKVISGAEANEIGLVTHLTENPYDEAMALAKEIANKNPYAIRWAKKLTEMAGRETLEDGFDAEQVAIRELIGSPNQTEAVVANMEKRAPKFADYEG